MKTQLIKTLWYFRIFLNVRRKLFTEEFMIFQEAQIQNIILITFM